MTHTHMRKATAISVISTLIFAISGLYVFLVPHAGAARTVTSGSVGTKNVSDLGELIVTDGLFGAGSAGTGIGGASRLGELIVLDNLFKGRNNTTSSMTNTSNLGELIVLDGLFGGSMGVGGVSGKRVSRLGELIVLNNLFVKKAPVVAPTPQKPTDVTAPTISNVQVLNISTSTARVKWTTNESATGKVYVSTTTPVVLSKAKVFSSSVASTTQNILLSGMTASTTQFYIVEAKDKAGNISRTVQSSFATGQ